MRAPIMLFMLMKKTGPKLRLLAAKSHDDAPTSANPLPLREMKISNQTHLSVELEMKFDN
jgi:hypothetical protein